MSDVHGVPLSEVQEPIRAALDSYAKIADGTLEFDLDTASLLELTPDKPNSARSVSTVKYLGETVSTLYVIAFAPQDGTGDESAFKLSDTDTRTYPEASKVIPRRKTGVASEAHLALLSQKLASTNADPVLFAGHMDLVGGEFGTLGKIATLGQDEETYRSAMDGLVMPEPVSTLTTGYSGTIDNLGDVAMWDYWRKRFGDPHAVFNAQEELQIAGFMAIPSEGATNSSLDVLRAIKSVEPRRL